MKNTNIELRFGVAFLVLALITLLFTMGIVVFNRDGTGVNFGIVYTAFAFVVLTSFGGPLTYIGLRRQRYLKLQQL